MAKRRRKKKRSSGVAAAGGAPREGARAAPAPTAKTALWLWTAIGLAGAGLVLTAYLTLVAWFGEHPAYCESGSGCDIVQQSRWSTLLALPLSLWGSLLYAIILRYLWRLRSRASAWRGALTLAALGFAYSVYLTGVSAFEIEALCSYCLASLALLTALTALLAVKRPAQLTAFRWPGWLTGTAGAAAIIIAGLHMHYSGVFDPGAGPEKPYLKALATHLEQSGARFYGAYWCPNCEEQKEAFEASAHRLPYVECTPEGRSGPRALACVDRNINVYPTWIVGARRVEGQLSPQSLARMSGFQWEGPTR